MTKANTQLSGHGLASEGAPYDEFGMRSSHNTASGTGVGICRCGAKSPILRSAGQRQQWHREHKAAIRAESERGR